MFEIAGQACLTFVTLAVMFCPLERAFPEYRQGMIRARSGLDLVFFLSQQLCTGYVIVAALSWLHVRSAALPLAAAREAFASQPFALCVIEVVMLGDLLAYWGHRAQHRFELLWRFHAVHHSSEHLDWLAANREHPLDGLYTQFLLNLPLILTGFMLDGAAGIVVFRGAWAVFIHSNVRIPLGPLAWILGSPQLHHLHHERSRTTYNFGNLSPWTDLLFRTHRAASLEPPKLGLLEPFPDTFIEMLLQPLTPKSREDRREARAVQNAAQP